MKLDDPSKAAARSVLLKEVGAEAVEDLFSNARQVRYARGEMIFAIGESATGVILIDTGRVEISTMSISGRKSVLAYMGPGELLGEIAALDGGNRSADAVAATSVEGRFLGRENILDFIAVRPDLAKAVIVELCKKARNASEMFVTQSLPEAEVRLARTLLRVFETWGKDERDGSMTLTERFSQQDLGEFCGLARENVNRQIKSWTQKGLLKNEGRNMVLLDRDGLQRIAES